MIWIIFCFYFRCSKLNTQGSIFWIERSDSIYLTLSSCDESGDYAFTDWSELNREPWAISSSCVCLSAWLKFTVSVVVSLWWHRGVSVTGGSMTFGWWFANWTSGAAGYTFHPAIFPRASINIVLMSLYSPSAIWSMSESASTDVLSIFIKHRNENSQQMCSNRVFFCL